MDLRALEHAPDLDHERMNAIVLLVDDEPRPHDGVRGQLALTHGRGHDRAPSRQRVRELRSPRPESKGPRTRPPIHHLVASIVGVCMSKLSSCGMYVAVVWRARTLDPCARRPSPRYVEHAVRAPLNRGVA